MTFAATRGIAGITLLLAWSAPPAIVAGEASPGRAGAPPVSDDTDECIGCHEDVTPGIVADWRTSRHASVSTEQALARPALERRISAAGVPEDLARVAVGCFECHGARAEAHENIDAFDHFDYRIHTVVSPDDCANCHPTERDEYAGSKKAHAVGNLGKNPIFHTLVRTALDVAAESAEPTSAGEEDRLEASLGDVLGAHLTTTERDTCFGCHGTVVRVEGTHRIETDIGEVVAPRLSGWPNQGVGRINPDGSQGACTACHPRHSFSLEVARKPYTCAQCHLEPDVPAYNVYKESKHGNLFFSKGQDWNWDAVPWVVGRDFTAPTCATCHSALVVHPEGDVIAPRTHDFGARLWVRLFGLPYAHPQPLHGDTSTLRNADGQPLPATFAGVPASEGLLGPEEQASRRAAMERLCRACHASQWAESFFDKMQGTIEATNAHTLAATRVLQEAWEKGLADPANPFDEPLERMWVEQWLFYASSIRYASAMSGPDYATFKNGWWQMSRGLREMRETLKRARE